jgi:hypothetical protein
MLIFRSAQCTKIKKANYKTHKAKKMNNTDPSKKPMVILGAPEGYAVTVFDKTPTILFI